MQVCLLQTHLYVKIKQKVTYIRMLTSNQLTAEDTIVHFLSKGGNKTAQAILDHLHQKQHKITLQGAYRILRKLEETGVIIKLKKTYSLKIAWLLDLSALVQTMEGTYLQQHFAANLIPVDDKAKISWHFNDLQKMNNFWCQILLSLAHINTLGYSLSIAPHIWLERLHLEHQENQFRKNYLSLVKEYCLVESKSFLDTYINKKQNDKNNNEEYFLASKDQYISKQRNKYIDVIGDYIVTVTFDKKATQLLDTEYERIKSLDDVLSFDVSRIFTRSMRIKLLLKKDIKQATNYRRKFNRLFGPL